jgi:hypothetical protein
MAAKKRATRNNRGAKNPAPADGDGCADLIADVDLDSSTESQPSFERGAIDANKVYPEKEFWAAVGISSRNTQKKYRDAGLPVRKVVGTGAMFILGKDWFDLLNRVEHIAKEFDASEQPPADGALKAVVDDINFRLRHVERHGQGH